MQYYCSNNEQLKLGPGAIFDKFGIFKLKRRGEGGVKVHHFLREKFFNQNKIKICNTFMICKELSKHFSHSAIVWKHFVRTHHGPCGMIISSFDSVAGRWAWYLYDFGFVFDCPCTLYSVHQNIADYPAMSIRPLPIADRVDDIESSKNPTRAKKRNHVCKKFNLVLVGRPQNKRDRAHIGTLLPTESFSSKSMFQHTQHSSK